jgi:hypothetical protein
MDQKITKLLPEHDAPVCITGMHRSGTSTITQLLYRCGLYLGPEKMLFSAREDNPEGFWEHRGFVALNERILELYGAGWDLPPSLEPEWHLEGQLHDVREDARRLVDRFAGQGRWGWKDPRSSLTLPFWLDLLSELKVLVCLRNPLEVALSLRRRGNSSLAFSFNLWMIYYERLLSALPEDLYLVTHYDAYYLRPLRELRHVVDFLGLPASDQLIAHARSSSIKDLRHYSFTLTELREAGAPEYLVELYVSMCRRARWDAK